MNWYYERRHNRWAKPDHYESINFNDSGDRGTGVDDNDYQVPFRSTGKIAN